MIVHGLEVKDVTICKHCGGLSGQLPVEWITYLLRCTCERRRTTIREPLPPGYDFTPFVDLCFCCGFTPIKSGVRWSPFFCPDCMQMVRSLNVVFRSAVIPVGRHSIMNSVMLKGCDAGREEKIKEFVENLGSLFHRVGLVADWRDLVVRRRIAELHLSEDEKIPFEKYLIYADGAVRHRERARAFRRLSAYLDVPDWYFAADFQETLSAN